MFQSPPGPQAGRYRDALDIMTVDAEFQSPPGPQAGRYPILLEHLDTGRVVSIPARPAGRALLKAKQPPWLALSAFQSPPGPQAGRYLRMVPRVTTCSRSFNPRPARRPGATTDFSLPATL